MHLVTLQLSQYSDLQQFATNNYEHPFSHRTLGTFVDTIKDLVTRYKPVLGYTSLGYCYLLFKDKPKGEMIDIMSSYASVRFNFYLKRHTQWWTAYDREVNFRKFLNNVYFTAKLFETSDPKKLFFELIDKTKEDAERNTSFTKSIFKVYPFYKTGVFSKLIESELITPKNNLDGTHTIDVKKTEEGVLIKLSYDELRDQMDKLISFPLFGETYYFRKYNDLMV